MDWLKYYNDLDIQKEIEESEKLNDLGLTASIFHDGSTRKKDGSKPAWSHQQFYFKNESERIVCYAIEQLKVNTMYLSAPALIAYINKERTNDLQNWTPIKNQFSVQAFFEANVIYQTFLTQLENSLQAKPEPKPLPSLEAIFQDKKDLKILVELLTEKHFCKVEAGRLTWTGIKHEARGPGLQMVALSETCKPLYNNNKFTAKELHQAWTTFFNYEMAVIKWQDGEIERYITDSYLRLFNFVKHSFRI